MDNRILDVTLRDRSPPPQAEVWVTIRAERRTPTTELRGRLTGPHCAFAATVEVAYPLRPLPVPADDPGTLTARVVIPEASSWEPETPLLYRGAVELWQDGARRDAARLTHGLRRLTLGPRGLRVNGRPLALRGTERAACTDAEALALRAEGYNLLVAPAAAETAALWELADRLGFFVLGRIRGTSPGLAALLRRLEAHASCLGWLAAAAALRPGAELAGLLPRTGRCLVGAEDVSGEVPPGVDFVAGAASNGTPVLLLDGAAAGPQDGPVIGRVS